MKYILYKESVLFCEEISIKEVAEEYGTPLYVYSKNQIVENFRAFNTPLAKPGNLVCYALKANANGSILKLLADEGAGADVVSGGELYLALAAGFAPDKIVFAGAGKREDEIEYAINQDIFSFNVESAAELQSISRLALRTGKKARISLRINPDIDAQSHPYITTGLQSTKFGIEGSKALEVYQFARTLPSLELIGIHTHIGSQITKIDPFTATASFIAGIIGKLREAGIHLTHIDFGGGLGVPYSEAITHEALPRENPEDNGVPAPAELLEAVLPILQPTGCSIWIEPGRAIVADAGLLVTRVISIKENSAKKFIIVDSGMNDLLRPSFYNAYHQIVPLSVNTYEHEQVDIVGPICENSDFFARDRLLPKIKAGEYLAILTAGAYGFALSSNYNGRPRPAEVLVNGDRLRVIRPRQTWEELAQ
jgi:diaminopimelate decarboxylase